MFIKFIMSKGENFTTDETQAKKILTSKEQLIPLISPETGKWTGETINKAYIISTKRDFDAESDLGLRLTGLNQKIKYLKSQEVPAEEKKLNQKEIKEIENKIKNLTDYFSIKRLT